MPVLLPKAVRNTAPIIATLQLVYYDGMLNGENVYPVSGLYNMAQYYPKILLRQLNDFDARLSCNVNVLLALHQLMMMVYQMGQKAYHEAWINQFQRRGAWMLGTIDVMPSGMDARQQYLVEQKLIQALTR